MTQPSNEPATVPTREAYGLLVFLTLLNVMNFVDRQLLASFSNFIVPDLGLTNTEFGLLTGLIFLAFYSVAGLLMGTFADRYHRTKLIAMGVAAWSFLTAVSGMAKGFVSLAIPRMFIGVGESILTPTSMSLLSDRFPSHRLGFASGFYYMGVPIGVGVSLLIVGYLGPLIGWRNCFYALGVIGLVLAGVMWFIRDPEREVKALAARSEQSDKAAQNFTAIIKTLAKALGHSPALVMTILGGVAFHFVLGAATFDQLWYVQERGFDRAEIAQLTGWIGIIAGISGNLFGGIGGDWLLKKDGHGAANVLVLCHGPFGTHQYLLSISRAREPLVLGGSIRRLLPTGMFLWPNVFDHSGTGAAADPCNRGCLLHSAAESRWSGDWCDCRWHLYRPSRGSG